MSKRTRKTFDCVRNMRQLRDGLSREIQDKSYEDIVRWLRSHRYADPSLERLARRFAPEADAARQAPARP